MDFKNAFFLSNRTGGLHRLIMYERRLPGRWEVSVVFISFIGEFLILSIWEN